MKHYIFLLFTLFYCNAYSQVGIGTDEPHSSSLLDVFSQNKGVLIPRVSLVATNSSKPVDNPENSLLVYNTATNISGSTSVSPGFYYWLKDNNQSGNWIRLAGESGQAWNIQGTDSPSFSSTDNIYHKGNVAVGFDSTDEASLKKFEVKGDFKSSFSRSGQSVGIETKGVSTNPFVLSLFNTSTQNNAGSYINLERTFTTMGSRSSSFHSYINTSQDFLSMSSSSITGTSINNISLSPRNKTINLYSTSDSSPIYTGRNFKSEIVIDGARGILFKYEENDNTFDSYMFPRTRGAIGQVLVSGGPPPGASYSLLEWKNISDLQKNYSRQVDISGRKWVNGSAIKEVTINVSLDDNNKKIIIPSNLNFTNYTKILSARLIHDTQTYITNNVLSYDNNTKELVMSPNYPNVSLPNGNYNLVLEFF